jgi:hypothetical protein
MEPLPRLIVTSTTDFEVTGLGDDPAWARADWVALRRRQADGHPYDARFKLLYSPTGLYALMDGTDRTLTATLADDFQELWTEDVFELFFWTDERYPLYFEYEISPLGQELPLLVPKIDGHFLGWRPWRTGPDRQTRRATSVTGGPKQPHARITGWRAEVFIPYALLAPLAHVPPHPGTTWRANVYRMDHDDGRCTQWEWAPVGDTFHQPERFGYLTFGE